VCSQSPHDKAVVARCAQFETILPLALKSKPATGMGRGKVGSLDARSLAQPCYLTEEQHRPCWNLPIG
jgi:hypothetical protein